MSAGLNGRFKRPSPPGAGMHRYTGTRRRPATSLSLSNTRGLIMGLAPRPRPIRQDSKHHGPRQSSSHVIITTCNHHHTQSSSHVIIITRHHHHTQSPSHAIIITRNHHHTQSSSHAIIIFKLVMICRHFASTWIRLDLDSAFDLHLVSVSLD